MGRMIPTQSSTAVPVPDLDLEGRSGTRLYRGGGGGEPIHSTQPAIRGAQAVAGAAANHVALIAGQMSELAVEPLGNLVES